MAERDFSQSGRQAVPVLPAHPSQPTGSSQSAAFATAPPTQAAAYSGTAPVGVILVQAVPTAEPVGQFINKTQSPRARGAAPGPAAAPPLGNSDELGLTTVIKYSPAWLISTIVHMLILITLGLWIFKTHQDQELQLEVVYAEKLGEQMLAENLDIGGDDDALLNEQVITPEDLVPVEDPFAAPPNVALDLGGLHTTSKIDAPVVGLALRGREVGMKQALLKAYGGNQVTQASVAEGLKWLSRQQQPQGYWSLMQPYADGSSHENRMAATAMALLAFQGAGHTHQGNHSDPYQKVVQRAVTWMLKQQGKTGNFFKTGNYIEQLYTHAQATIAICELYGMTKDHELYRPAMMAVQYAVDAQGEAGGWRYQPNTDSDLSVTGWFVMALQSAKMAGLEVPEPTLVKVRGFLDQVSDDNGYEFSYQPNSSTSLAMTAEGLLCRQYLGWKQDDPRLIQGANHLASHPPDWGNRDAYYWYYATQVCHHIEGEPWKKWNAVMRQLIPEKQIRTGKESGSWSPDGDAWGQHSGRLYVTCMHLLMLEVYYRHLPIYRYESFNKRP